MFWQYELENIVSKTNRGYSASPIFLTVSQILVFVGLLSLHVGAMAQQTGNDNPVTPAPGSIAANSGHVQASDSAVQLLPAAEPAAESPRNFKERFQDYRSATFSPWAVVMPAFGAGLSQLRNY